MARKYDHEYKVQAVNLAKGIGGAKSADDIITAIWQCMGYMALLCFTLFKTSSMAKTIFASH